MELKKGSKVIVTQDKFEGVEGTLDSVGMFNNQLIAVIKVDAINTIKIPVRFIQGVKEVNG